MNEKMVIIIIKNFFINIFTYYICFKIVKKQKLNFINIVIVVIASILSTLLYGILNQKINHLFVIFLIYIIQLIFLNVIMKDGGQSFIIITLIANSITYVLFMIATIFETLIKYLFKIHNGMIDLVLILMIEIIFIHGFFKIKRFSKGIDFLRNKTNNNYFEILMINISAIIIFAYCFFRNYDKNTITQVLIPFFTLGVIMLIMIQKTITLYYKQKLLAKTIDDYKSEIADKDEQIKKLSEEKFKISKLNHEFYNRQKSLEKKVNDFINNANVETAPELSVIESINKLTKEYSNGLENIKGLEKLPATEIEEIDDMFKYMQSECKNKNINFALQMNGNIHHLVNKIIPQDKLVTLIGDHIRDAIIAIDFSNNNFKSILVILGMKDNCYELCIYDSGIEFEIKTLEKLGLEPATTHKDTGGTGIGFMTTFETLKEKKASLIINERHGMSAEDYTKAIVIRFDGKNEYKICSYRADEIRKKIKDNRIIIEEL